MASLGKRAKAVGIRFTPVRTKPVPGSERIIRHSYVESLDGGARLAECWQGGRGWILVGYDQLGTHDTITGLRLAIVEARERRQS